MARRKTRKMMFIIGGAVLMALALITGAVLFTSQKANNARAASAPVSAPAANSSANTIQTTKTDNAAQPPAPAAPATDQQNPPAAPANGNNQAPNPVAPTNGNNQAPNPVAPANGGNQPSANNGNAAPNSVAPVPQQNATVFAQPLKFYGPQIQKMVAQGLNISDKQLATQLQAGKHIKDIAQAQSIPDAQLQTLISTSITNGFASAVQSGQLTQAQVSSFVTQTQQNPQVLEQTLSIAPPAPPHW